MISTNKIKVEFNKNNIDRDFDIFRICNEVKNIFYKTNALDITQVEFNAVSVVYTWGNTSYAMFEKGKIDKDKLKKAMNNEDINMQVQKVDILNEKIYENILTMLILNSLNRLKTGGEYSNLTGKLYLTNKSWFKQDKSGKTNRFHALEVKLSPEMELVLSVSTFGRLDYFKDPKVLSMRRYVFDKKTYELRRKLKSDNVKDEETFIQRSIYPKKHNTVPFLDFRSYKNYRKCKIGMLDHLLQDVEEYLNDYIEIESRSIDEYCEYKVTKNSYEKINYCNILKDKHIVLIDEIKNEYSEKLTFLIAELLRNKYSIVSEKKDEVDINCYNLKIIHGPDYYQDNDIEDPYNNVPTNCILQHITLESFEETLEKNTVEKAVVEKVLQELIIKGDILNSRISTVEWNKYLFDNEYAFVRRKKIKIGKDNYKYIYCKMRIFKDGTFDFDIYDTTSINHEDSWEWNAIEDSFNNKNGAKYGDEVEGIFYKNFENINIIYRTPKTTIPNFRDLRDLLKKTNKDEKIEVAKILNALENFDSDKKNIMEHKAKFAEKLTCFPEYETIGEINKELHIKSNGGKAINKFILEQLDILINPELKTGDRKYQLFGSMLGIKYYKEKNNIYYFVGVEPKDINLSFNNACTIRKIVADEVNEFENIAKLLSVDFVKNGQYTVVPFPFKYINEVLEKL
ncbi:hypothetical protein [Clostridium baratii]|uniref:hypothetical protein n=1 Tax=Clostridium baratii TaxID=1561 RepID=UPI003D34DBD0